LRFLAASSLFIGAFNSSLIRIILAIEAGVEAEEAVLRNSSRTAYL